MVHLSDKKTMLKRISILFLLIFLVYGVDERARRIAEVEQKSAKMIDDALAEQYFAAEGLRSQVENLLQIDQGLIALVKASHELRFEEFEKYVEAAALFQRNPSVLSIALLDSNSNQTGFRIPAKTENALDLQPNTLFIRNGDIEVDADGRRLLQLLTKIEGPDLAKIYDKSVQGKSTSLKDPRVLVEVDLRFLLSPLTTLADVTDINLILSSLSDSSESSTYIWKSHARTDLLEKSSLSQSWRNHGLRWDLNWFSTPKVPAAVPHYTAYEVLVLGLNVLLLMALIFDLIKFSVYARPSSQSNLI